MRVAALIVAAGRGSRAGQGLPKQYRTYQGKPLIRHCLEAFAAHPRVEAIQVVIHPDDQILYSDAAEGLDLPAPVSGGDSRQASGLNGLEALAGKCDAVLIHDAARPHLSAALIDRAITTLEAGAQAALPLLPVTDTMRRVVDGQVGETVPREELGRAQTPQAFAFEAILSAHRQAVGAEPPFTDDAAVAQAVGLSVQAIEGDLQNEKITFAEDFEGSGDMEYRSGTGFDVHRFEPGDAVILCGLSIPHSAKLAGHSDADVAWHALTDALLGAVGKGDIGQHFPPSDPQWKGAASEIFLAGARDTVAGLGGRITSVDVTLICEAPKVGPHRSAMAEKTAEVLGIDVSRVNIKATTTEKLGFTGRGEGIAAQAMATVALPR